MIINHSTIIFFLFLLGINQDVYADPIDSMLTVLSTDISTRERISTHNRLAGHYSRGDTTQFLYHKNMMDSISKVENDTMGQFLTYGLNVTHFFRLEQLDSVEFYSWKCLSKARDMNVPRFITGSLFNLAQLKNKLYQPDSAIYYAKQVYDQVKSNPKNMPSNVIRSMTFLGDLHHNNLQYDEALLLYFEADELASTMSSASKNNSLGSIYKSISKTYTAIGDTLIAKNYLLRSIDLYTMTDNLMMKGDALFELSKLHQKSNPDSAFHYLDLSYKSTSELGSQGDLADISKEMGDYWDSQGELGKAMSHYTESLKIFIRNERKHSIADTYLKIGRLHKKKNNFREALQSFDEAHKRFKELGVLESAYHAQKSRSETLKLLGDHKNSLLALNDAIIIKDSIDHKSYSHNVKEIQTKYETEKKEAELVKQNLIISKQASEKKYLINGGLGILTTLGLLLWSITSRAKRNKQIADQQQELQDRKIEQLKKEKTILSMSSMIEGQEAERKRIAQDLHDGLGGLLATVKTKFGVIQNQIQELESINVYREANQLLDHACTEVRKIAHNMMPDSLLKLGLVEAVRDMTDHYSGIDIKVINLGLHPMNETQQVMLYRTIQEFMNNTRKHAQATEVIIQFSLDDESNMIYLEDDGQGFDKRFLTDQSGIGLQGMESRISFIGGTIDIESVIGVGTTVSIQIPRYSQV